jgi:hypothetical protein
LSNGEHTLFGLCSGCREWVPRDEMLSINTSVYSAENNKVIIRQRYCPVCAREETERLKGREWDHIVVTGQALAPMPDGSPPPNEVVRERGRLARGAHPDVQPSPEAPEADADSGAIPFNC